MKLAFNSPWSGKQSSPTYQIHYLCVYSKEGVELISFLGGLGINCTEPQRNIIQGTISTLIFWKNIYLELLWFDEKSHRAFPGMTAELEFNLISRANWHKTKASPFSLGLEYQTENANLSISNIEVINKDRTLASENSFLPSNLVNFDEPIYYVFNGYEATKERLNRFLASSQQNVTQALGMEKLTHLKMRLSSDLPLSAPLLDFVQQNILEIEKSKYPLLELTFDDYRQKKSLDLRPLIPIVMKY